MAALVLSPLVNIASDQKRARFLSLLREVGKETLTSEPDCLAYIWLLSVTETTAIRGVEIYRNDSALEDTHRRGTAYEKFRTVLIEEQLAPPPTAAALCRGRLVEKSRLPDPVNSSGPLVAITGSVSVLTITYARSEEILAILGIVADEPREKDQIAFVISDLEESRQILVVGVFASRKAADRARSTWKSLGQG
ncbi:hypothetical protein N7448_004440 [Penicillium atrosanguineum]|nr:hypothetical protein N7448_004440 [Penicillium atrosanguineum]